MQAHTTVSNVIAGAIFSLAFVALGVAVGYCFALPGTKPLRKAQPHLPLSIAVPPDLYQLLNAQLLTRIQMLAALALEHQTTIPSPLWHAIDELAQATRKLKLHIEGVTEQTMRSIPSHLPSSAHNRTAQALEATSPEAAAPEKTTFTRAQPSSLTGGEFQQLTAEEAQGTDCQQLTKRRRRYEARQVIYPCCESEDGRTLAPAATVRCHDLGVEGVSFFWPVCPPFETLVIALGPEAMPVYLVAQVMNSKAVVMHGESCYLVGCRFISRLKRFSDIVLPLQNLKGNLQPFTEAAPAMASP